MKNELLISLLALSGAPTAALANADVAIEKEAFTGAGLTVADDGTVSLGTDEITMTKYLCPGKYQLHATDWSNCTIKVVYGGKSYDLESEFEITGVQTAEVTIKITSENGGSYSYKNLKFELIYDFQAKAQEYSAALSTITNKAQASLQKDPNWSENSELMSTNAELAGIINEINKAEGDNAYTVYANNKLWGDDLSNKIAAFGNSVDAEITNYEGYTAAYAAVASAENQYAEVTELYNAASDEAKAANKEAYDALDKYIEDFKAQIEEDFKAGNGGEINTDAFKSEVDKGCTDLKKKFEDSQKYEAAFDQIKAAYEAACKTFDAASAELQNTMANDNVFSDWFAAAREEMKNAKDAMDAEYEKVAKDKSLAPDFSIDDNITANVTKITTAMQKYTGLYNKAVAVKKAADEVVAKLKASLADATTCPDVQTKYKSEITAVNTSIATLESTIKTDYETAGHAIVDKDYSNDYKEIETLISNIKSDSGYDKTVANYNYYQEILAACEDETGTLRKELAAANEAVNALKPDAKDDGYSASAKFKQTASDLKDAIDKIASDAKTQYGKTKITEAKYKAFVKSINQCSDNIKTYQSNAEAAQKKENEVYSALVTYGEKIDALAAKATDRNANLGTPYDGCTTYGELIDNLNAKKKAIKDAFDAANGLLDSKHYDALMAITLNDEISTTAEAYTKTYDTDKSQTDSDSQVAAAKVLYNNAITLVETLEKQVTSDETNWKNEKADAPYYLGFVEYDNIIKDLNEVKTAIAAQKKAITDVATDEDAINAENAVAAQATLIEAKKKVDELSLTLAGVEKTANDRNTWIRGEVTTYNSLTEELSEIKTTATTAYGKIPSTVGRSAFYAAYKKFTTSAKETEAAIETEYGKEVLQDSKEAFETKIASLKTTADSLATVAENLVNNHTNYGEVEAYYNKQYFSKLISDCEAALRKNTSDANLTYYLNVLEGYKAKAKAYKTGTLEKDEVEGYLTAYQNVHIVTDEQEKALTDMIDKLVSDINGLPEKAKADKQAYDSRETPNSHVQWYNSLTDRWNEVSTKFNNSDLAAATLQTKLQELAAIKTKIEEQGELIDKYFAEGESANKDKEVTAAFEELSQELKQYEDFIAGDENYDKAIATDNADRYQRFLTMVGLTDDAYTAAKDRIKEYQAIKHEDLKNLVNIKDIMDAQDKIYSYGTLIADLKTEAQKTNLETVSPDLWDAKEEYKARAKQYTEEINANKETLESVINAAASKLLNDSLTAMEADLKAAKEAIENYDKKVKDKAFNDVEELYKKCSADSYKKDPALLANLDADWDKISVVKVTLATEKENAAVDDWGKVYGGTYVGKDGKIKKTDIRYNGAKKANEKVLAEMQGYTTIDKAELEKYIESYKAGVETTLTAAVTQATAATAAGNMFEEHDAVFALVDEFYKLIDGSDATSPYIQAQGIEKDNTANAEAYETLTKAYNGYLEELEKASAYCRKLNVANDKVKALFENAAAQVANWQEALTKENASAQLKAYTDGKYDDAFKASLKRIYTGVNSAEIAKIREEISKIKAEKEDAYAKFINTDSEKAKDILDYYEENCAGLADELTQLETALAKVAEDKQDTQLLTFEQKVAKKHAEFTKLWKSELIAEQIATLQQKVNDAKEDFEAAQADFDKAHKPVQNQYNDDLEGCKDTFEQAEALFEASKADSQVQTYSDKIIYLLELAVNDVKKVRENVNEADKPYIIHDKRYAELVKENADIRAEIDRLQGIVDSMHWMDAYSFDKTAYLENYNGLYNNNVEQLENAQKAAEEGNVSALLKESSNLTTPLTRMAIYVEYDEHVIKWIEAKQYYAILIDEANSKLKDAYTTSKTYDPDGSIKTQYDAYNKSHTNWDNYTEPFSSGSYTATTAKDINGNLWDEQGSAKTINFVKDAEGFDLIKTTAEELVANMNQLTESIKENTYVLGDVDGDKEVYANDYNAIVKALLNNDLTGKEFAAADIDGDGELTIGDATKVAVKVITGTFPNSASGAKAKNAPAATAETMTLAATGQGDIQRIAINLNSAATYVGCQMDIILPAGMTVVSESLGDRANGHDLLSNDIDGKHRVVISNIETSAFNGGEAILYLDVQGGNAGGVAVENVIFADANGRISRIGGSSTTGINGVEAESSLKQKIYSVGGQILNKVKNGINIIRNANGKTQKVAK